MDESFDFRKAKEYLQSRESHEREANEHQRTAILAKVVDSLKSLFAHTELEIYLVGSIIQPYKFSPQSDVDIVLKNFKGDRFELWTHLEALIQRNVELIIFENCHFQEHIIKTGYKVL